MDEKAKLLLKLVTPQQVWGQLNLIYFLSKSFVLLLSFTVSGVNTSMMMRDIETEARRLLSSPEDIPP